MAKRSAERTDFLAGIIITAVEGGINYWAYARKYRWVDSNGKLYGNALSRLQDASVEVCDVEDFDDGKGQWKKVTLDTIARGIGKIKRKEVSLSHGRRKIVIAADRDPDKHAGNIDSDIADCVLQAGLFGTIIYG